MDYVSQFFYELWLVSLEAAPWLLIGMFVAGVIKTWLPTSLLQRLLGGRGIWPILKAAVIGTPLPLCSCSVIPAAVALRRSGVSKGSTVSFLVSTPENGADSIALSYALLGPFMTVARPVTAIISAVVAGIATLLLKAEEDQPQAIGDQSLSVPSLCCGSNRCCDDQASVTKPAAPSIVGKLRSAVSYASYDLFKDIVGWLALGLALAALMNTLIPPEAMASWGSGFLAMLAVMLVGVPMYICATASTPVAASMLLAGVSPGTVLVFLLAGPATNMATIGIVRRELGFRSVVAYLLGVCGSAVLLGLLTDWIVSVWQVEVTPQLGEHAHLIPHWLEIASFAVLALMAMNILLQVFRPTQSHLSSSSA